MCLHWQVTNQKSIQMKLTWIVETLFKNGYRVIKTKITKGIVETSKTANPYGFDSNPTKNYIAIVSGTMSNEEPVVVGYLNPRAFTTLNPGDSAQYATNENGDVVGTIVARNNGTIEILGNDDNAVRFSKLKTAYEELQTKVNDLVIAFNQHVHATAGSGPPSPPTPVPNTIPAIPSSGDIEPSKIDQIKVPGQ